MINYNPKLWFKHIFHFPKSDTIYVLWKELVIIGLFSAGITYVEIEFMEDTSVFQDMIAVYSLIGFVLSLLLVFRTNTAYDRWWEGRKKWGELVNNSRNLAIKISSMIDNKEDRAFFSRMIPNYAFSMKEHLRGKVIIEELELTDTEKAEIELTEHKPNFVAHSMYKKLHTIKKEKRISEEEFLSIDNNLKTFSDIIGACERIRNTPIPYSYSLFLKKFIFLYVITLPLGFVSSFGYYTPAISIFIFYILVSLEVLAEEIEDPFGKDANDLPTGSLSKKIRANVQEVLR